MVDDTKRVNKRERDGESDIFTAVFNGQSVNFIIKMDDNARIYAGLSRMRTGTDLYTGKKSGLLILSRKMRSVLTVSVINRMFLPGI